MPIFEYLRPSVTQACHERMYGLRHETYQHGYDDNVRQGLEEVNPSKSILIWEIDYGLTCDENHQRKVQGVKEAVRPEHLFSLVIGICRSSRVVPDGALPSHTETYKEEKDHKVCMRLCTDKIFEDVKEVIDGIGRVLFWHEALSLWFRQTGGEDKGCELVSCIVSNRA